MTKLKYILQEGEEIVRDLKDLTGLDVIVAVVKKKPITEKELVEKVKKTKTKKNK